MYSFDWRCDACERPNQHDFPTDIAVARRDPADVSAPPDTSREQARSRARGGGGGRDQETLECSACHQTQPISPAGFDHTGALEDPLEGCLVCGSPRMYSRKDFNSKLGIAIVAVGAVFSPWTYGLSLVACMGLDYGLYYFVPEITVCYACDAIHRGFEHNPAHRAHDPLLAERFRREARQELGLEPLEDEAES